MNLSKNSASARASWLGFTAVAAIAAAALRRWQLSSAFEAGTGLAARGAQASVILTCVLVMAGAWFVLLSLRPHPAGQGDCWDLVFLGAGDPAYPALEVAAALFAIASVPVLFIVGVGQFQLYQELLAAKAQNSSVQLPTNNGMLTLATAAGAFLAALGLLQMGRDGLRPGRRGRGGFAAALPGVAGCVWLMESFRAHAANPVRWDYAPQLLAIVLGMAFYMEFAGLSAGVGRPGRLLWLAGMTVVFSALTIVSAAAELSALSELERPLCSTQLGDLLLLISQTLAAAGVLWRLPPRLDDPPKPRRSPRARPEPTHEIQEETTDE